jgi:pantetheine-phosphate adenylyltransferase
MPNGLSPYKAVYTGSFDPVTLGHLHIIERAAKLFESLIVGIGINSTKQSLFSIDERIALIRKVTGHLNNVTVEAFDGLAVDYVRSIGAKVMVRGVRPLTDIASEFTMMMANRQLDADIETVFLMADEVYAHVSSTLIKQIASQGSGRALERFVPQAIISDLLKKMELAQRAAP